MRAEVMPEPDLPLTGGCLCGGVRCEVIEPLLLALYCHCGRCRRRTGTGPSFTGIVVPGSYRVTAGAELIGSYQPPDGGWIKTFCSRCGSQLATRNPDQPEMVGVRIGSFDEDPGIRAAAHQFTDYAAPWAPVPDDGARRFRERIPAGEMPGL